MARALLGPDGLVGSFLGWWAGELGSLMPGWLKRLFGGCPAVLVVEPRDDAFARLTLWRGARRRPLEDLPLALDAGARRRLLSRALGRFSRRPLLAVRLPRALARRLTLPAAAGRDLAEVLRLDMDRQTPFRADQVRFSHRIVGRDRAAGTIAVALAVAPEEACAGAARLAAELRLPLAYAGPRSEPPWDDNLLAEARGLARRSVPALAAACLVLAGVAIWLPLDRAEGMRDRLEAEIEAVRRDAAAAEARRDGFLAVAAAAEQAGRDRRSPLDVLDAVTRALPDDAHLDGFVLREGRVEVTGAAAATARVVERLSAEGMFEAIEYRAAVLTGDDGREHFSLAFRLAEGPPQ
jgi:general secretion pathway protein L